MTDSPAPPRTPETGTTVTADTGQPTNAFSARFLDRLATLEREATGQGDGSATLEQFPIYLDRELAGPWRVLPLDHPEPSDDRDSTPFAWGCFSDGTDEAHALFVELRDALLAAAALPALAHCDGFELADPSPETHGGATGPHPGFVLRRRGTARSDGSAEGADGSRTGEVIGSMEIFRPELATSLGWLSQLTSRADDLAHLLQAVPRATLEEAGALLAARTLEPRLDPNGGEHGPS